MTLDLSSDMCTRVCQLWRRIRSLLLYLLIRASTQNVSLDAYVTRARYEDSPDTDQESHTYGNVRLTLFFIKKIR
jgi:hypothetical protein